MTTILIAYLAISLLYIIVVGYTYKLRLEDEPITICLIIIVTGLVWPLTVIMGIIMWLLERKK